MSVRVMAEVFAYSRSTLGARLVLLAIADSVDDQHRECWPGLEVLARKARLTGRAVQYAVEKLVALGELEVRPRPGHSNVWHIPPMATWHAIGEQCTPEEGFRGEKSSGVNPASGGDEASFVPPTKPASSISVTDPSSSVTGGGNTRGWRRVPPGEELTADRKKMAWEVNSLNGQAAAREWAAFCDHEFKDPKKDVDATWRNWCRKVRTQQAAPPPAPGKRTDREPGEPTRLGAIGVVKHYARGADIPSAAETRRRFAAMDRRDRGEDVGL